MKQHESCESEVVLTQLMCIDEVRVCGKITSAECRTEREVQLSIRSIVTGWMERR